MTDHLGLSGASKKQEYEAIHKRHRCDARDSSAPGGYCRNEVTHWAQPVGYTGPIYCKDHAYLANPRRGVSS